MEPSLKIQGPSEEEGGLLELLLACLYSAPLSPTSTQKALHRSPWDCQ